MSFNPLMAYTVAALAPRLAARESVVELGNQTLNCRGVYDDLVKRYPGMANRPKTVDEFYRRIGFSTYAALDVNTEHGSAIVDLNLMLPVTDQYDLVTNNGTGEHIFNQVAVFTNMHNLCKVRGVMLHVMPTYNWINHGFYQFQPKTYLDLAYANRYALLMLGFATRTGAKIDFLDGRKTISAPECKRAAAKARDKLTRNRTVDMGLFVVAALEKTRDDPFRIPCDGKYLDAIADKALRRRYDPA